MDELEEELGSLVEIFAEELEIVRDDTEIRMSLPLRLKWQLVFVINAIRCQSYAASVILLKPHYAVLDVHQGAANNALFAATTYLNGRILNEHKPLYTAYQCAIDAFDDFLSNKNLLISKEPYEPEAKTQKLEFAAKKNVNNEAQSKQSGIPTTNDKAASVPPDTLETAIIILDHINDSKRYYKALSNFAHQLSLSCIVFAKNPSNTAGDRIKYAIVIIQSQSNNSEFIRKLKTENVDLNKAGKPCKERCSSTILVTCQYNYFEIGNIFKVIDCSTTDAIGIIQNKYLASEVSEVVGKFCLPKR